MYINKPPSNKSYSDKFWESAQFPTQNYRQDLRVDQATDSETAQARAWRRYDGCV